MHANTVIEEMHISTCSKSRFDLFFTV